MISPETPFIFLLTRHRVLGHMVIPYIVERSNPVFLTPVNVLSEETIVNFQDELPEWMPAVLELSGQISENHLAKRFSRSKNAVDFLREIDEKVLQDTIRPFLDKKINQLLLLARKHDIPVYSGSSTVSLFAEMQVGIDSREVTPWFNFRKKEEGITYILEIEHDGNKLGIFNAGATIISHTPCWLQLGNRLYPFPEGFDGIKLKPFLEKQSLEIPKSSEQKYFQKFILKNIRSGHVKAEGFEILDQHPAPAMELSLETDWQGNAVFTAWFVYGSKRVLSGNTLRMFIDLVEEEGGVSFYRIHRDFSWEENCRTRLEELGLKWINENTLSLPTLLEKGEAIYYPLVRWASDNHDKLSSFPARVAIPEGVPAFYTGPLELEWREESGPDWFDIYGTVRLEGFEIPFIRFRKHILNGIRTYKLPDDRLVLLPEEWFHEYREAFLFGSDNENRLRVRRWHRGLLPDAGRKRIDVNIGIQEEYGTVDIPADLQAVLRHYQEEGLRWMQWLHHNGYGGCLADDMGLGKTVQAIALLLSRRSQEKQASLIVMPATLIHNWKNELEKFAPGLSFFIHTGSQRPETSEPFPLFDVILTTYGTVRNDIDFLEKYTFHYIILDESQAIKNPDAKVSRAIFRLQSGHRLVLTGTPVENTLHDLWSQMNFLNPGLLGSRRLFEEEFLDRMEQSAQAGDKLRQLISPFILRRRKQEVEPELPPLTEKILYCDMTEEHRIVYETELATIRRQILENMETGKTHYNTLPVLRALIRMRQISNHPRLVDPKYHGDSGKMEEIRHSLNTLLEENHKVLVFSSFVKHLMIVAGWLEESGRKFALLTGSTRNRKEVINTFRKDPERQVFLISLKAGGVGLNLTEAGYVLVLDPWWNPASEQQAIHRAHRIGQNKPVIAYKFITQGSIEEKILKLQEKKRNLYKKFIPSANPLKDLTQEEVRGLFGE